ncbi:hypothetical protein CsatB_026509 [Cannabis sativa]
MEEAKDFGKMKVEELMGSFRTFELNKKIKKKSKQSSLNEKSKGIAFNVSEHVISDDDNDDEMALLTKNFQDYMKSVGNKRNFSKTPKGNISGNDFSKFFSSNKVIRCRECDVGFCALNKIYFNIIRFTS